MDYKNRNNLTDKNKRIYYVSVYQPDIHPKTREEKSQVIIEAQNTGYSKLRISKNFTKDPDKFLSSYLINLGYHGTEKYLKNIKGSTEGLQADFLFFDFDNKENGEAISPDDDDRYMSFSRLESIMKNSDLNYIIKTSANHRDGYEKMHLLVATLKPLLSNEEVKLYRSAFLNQFPILDQLIDKSTSGFSQNIIPSHPETVKVS